MASIKTLLVFLLSFAVFCLLMPALTVGAGLLFLMVLSTFVPGIDAVDPIGFLYSIGTIAFLLGLPLSLIATRVMEKRFVQRSQSRAQPAPDPFASESERLRYNREKTRV